jgi:hypothetical protein
LSGNDRRKGQGHGSCQGRRYRQKTGPAAQEHEMDIDQVATHSRCGGRDRHGALDDARRVRYRTSDQMDDCVNLFGAHQDG